jgi:3-dehydroquinate synthase
MQTLHVDLGERSYPIHIGAGLLSQGHLVVEHLKSKQVCVVTNTTIAPLFLPTLRSQLTDFDLLEVILPDGEEFKTLDTLSTIFDALLERNFSRSCTLIALGGGVIGDMTGFAASVYQRGINFIQIPTTLLSQVDSSVGGKTGVNRPLGKNMVGAFYQPKAVIIDTQTLLTLPERELKAGLAEVIKYGLINNQDFHYWIKANLPKLLAKQSEALTYAIRTSCAEKAAIVAADEREGGIRAILNLGHTFGHAIETAMGYGVWLHGEAVAAGMVLAAELSLQLCRIEPKVLAEVRAVIEAAGLPVTLPEQLDSKTFIQLMRKDKKAEQGQMTFILLDSVGKAAVVRDVESASLERLLSGD